MKNKSKIDKGILRGKGGSRLRGIGNQADPQTREQSSTGSKIMDKDTYFKNLMDEALGFETQVQRGMNDETES